MNSKRAKKIRHWCLANYTVMIEDRFGTFNLFYAFAKWHWTTYGVLPDRQELEQ